MTVCPCALQSFGGSQEAVGCPRADDQGECPAAAQAEDAGRY